MLKISVCISFIDRSLGHSHIFLFFPQISLPLQVTMKSPKHLSSKGLCPVSIKQTRVRLLLLVTDNVKLGRISCHGQQPQQRQDVWVTKGTASLSLNESQGCRKKTAEIFESNYRMTIGFIVFEMGYLGELIYRSHFQSIERCQILGLSQAELRGRYFPSNLIFKELWFMITQRKCSSVMTAFMDSQYSSKA